MGLSTVDAVILAKNPLIWLTPRYCVVLPFSRVRTKTKINKNILLVFFPETAGNIISTFFKNLGYNVINIELDSWDDFRGPQGVTVAKRDYPEFFSKVYLSTIDVVVVSVGVPTPDFVVQGEFLTELKRVLSQTEKSPPIPIVGMHPWLSREITQQYAKLFDGRFIHEDSTSKEVHQYLGGSIN